MDLRKFSISTSVFFTSLEYTSLATSGVKGTCLVRFFIFFYFFFVVRARVDRRSVAWVPFASSGFLSLRVGAFRFEWVSFATCLGAQFLRDAQGQGGLSRSRRSGQQQRPSGHLLLSDEVHHQSARLSRLSLTDESASHGMDRAVLLLSLPHVHPTCIRGPSSVSTSSFPSCAVLLVLLDVPFLSSAPSDPPLSLSLAP